MKRSDKDSASGGITWDILANAAAGNPKAYEIMKDLLPNLNKVRLAD